MHREQDHLRFCVLALSRSRVSRPPIPGIVISKTTRSRRQRATSSSTCRPSSASPETFRSGSASSRRRSPSRTIPWSSAMTIEIVGAEYRCDWRDSIRRPVVRRHERLGYAAPSRAPGARSVAGRARRARPKHGTDPPKGLTRIDRKGNGANACFARIRIAVDRRRAGDLREERALRGAGQVRRPRVGEARRLSFSTSRGHGTAKSWRAGRGAPSRPWRAASNETASSSAADSPRARWRISGNAAARVLA